jgi:tRNA-dihydrouridine synthase B
MRVNFKVYNWVMLAPAAGVTDSITRKVARKWGADAVVSELISAEGMTRNCIKTKALTEFDESERPIGIQLFGANPDSMAEAARIVTGLKPDFIDLNFGCPAKKVVGKNGGSSLLKDLPLLTRIIRQVVEATELPVTIKYRSGWGDSSIVAVEVAKIAEDNGVAAICLHPRTRAQGFAGQADWRLLAEVKKSVGIPVIGSGDIDSPEKAKKMFEQTGCDAIMVCRASFGNPWIFKRIKAYLEEGKLVGEPGVATRISTALEHLHESIARHGDFGGLVRMRGQLAWYIKGLPQAAKIRARLVRLPTEAEVVELLNNYKKELIEQGYGTAEDIQAA